MSTGGTLIEAINICENHGSKEIYAGATHGIFAGDVIERLDKSCAKKVVVTNKIPNEKLNQSLNLIAAILMAIGLFPKNAWFSFALQVAWALIGIIAIIKIIKNEKK